jgi:hypothetical protein
VVGEASSSEESSCLACLLVRDGLVDCGGAGVCGIAAGLSTSKLISTSSFPAIDDES